MSWKAFSSFPDINAHTYPILGNVRRVAGGGDSFLAVLWGHGAMYGLYALWAMGWGGVGCWLLAVAVVSVC